MTQRIPFLTTRRRYFNYFLSHLHYHHHHNHQYHLLFTIYSILCIHISVVTTSLITKQNEKIVLPMIVPRKHNQYLTIIVVVVQGQITGQNNTRFIHSRIVERWFHDFMIFCTAFTHFLQTNRNVLCCHWHVTLHISCASQFMLPP